MDSSRKQQSDSIKSKVLPITRHLLDKNTVLFINTQSQLTCSTSSDLLLDGKQALTDLQQTSPQLTCITHTQIAITYFPSNSLDFH